MRNIPENNMGIPVFIKLNNGGSGSGFLLATDKNAYLITAKHVLFDEAGNLRDISADLVCQTHKIDEDSTHILGVDLGLLNTNNNILTHTFADIAALKIANVNFTSEAKFTQDYLKGVVLKQRGNGEFVSIIPKTVSLMKSVLISNDVFVYGYPSSLGLRESPQFDYNKPLLRKGIVASINKKSGTIILDCPVYYGNSGGPVIQVNLENGTYTHSLIGIVSQFIPFEEDWINTKNNLMHKQWSNSGYSVAVAMDFVFDMLGIKME